eukprot:1152613-Pelagomonas_calceolata.AAC.5
MQCSSSKRFSLEDCGHGFALAQYSHPEAATGNTRTAGLLCAYMEKCTAQCRTSSAKLDRATTVPHAALAPPP